MTVEDGEIAWSRPSQQDDDQDPSNSTITLSKEFRSKVKFMTKKWSPISKQNDRDRLELYSLAKQALKGDAPSSPSPGISIVEKTKYLAWKTKTGMTEDDAKTAFILESDRQMRVYGSKDPPIPSALVITEIMSSSKKAKAKRRAAAAAANGGVSSDDDDGDDDDSVGSFGSYSFIDDLSTTSSLLSKDSTLFSTPSRYVKMNDGTWSVSVPETPQPTSTSSTNSSPKFKPNEQHQKTKNDVARSVSTQLLSHSTPTTATQAKPGTVKALPSKGTHDKHKTKDGGTGSLSIPQTPRSTPTIATESSRPIKSSSSASTRQQQKVEKDTDSLSVPQTPQPTPVSGNNVSSTNTVRTSSRGSSNTNRSVTRRRPQQQQPFRGLPAIRLLCVAASESRPSYIRRMRSTGRNDGWWKRQVPLSAPSQSSSNSDIIEGLVGFPESMVIRTAGVVEEITLMSIGTVPSTVVLDAPRHQHRQHQNQNKNIVGRVITSFLWPFHQLLLVVWMLTILYVTTIQTNCKFTIEMTFGRPRSGGSVDESGIRHTSSSRMSKREWDANMESIAQSIVHMSAPKQSLSVRLAATILMPIPTVLNTLNNVVGRGSSMVAAKSIIFMIFLSFTWWYWGLVIPFIMCFLLWNSIGAGVCFAIIDLVGAK